MTTLVTGHAGFIGFHTTHALLARGETVVGLDSLDPYYDPALKRARLDRLVRMAPDGVTYCSVEGDVADADLLRDLFKTHRPTKVIHLAAQAGVRHSVNAPDSYTQTNLVGFANLLEACRHGQVAHLVFASTSSVYGAESQLPFTEDQAADQPLQYYAATKRANEVMAHAYSHLFGLPATALRFFSVYGPWGRPDMAPFLFTQAILAGQPIRLFNQGCHQRDFTFVDDIVEAALRVMAQPPARADRAAPYRVLNIGNGAPVALGRFVDVLEQLLGRRAHRELHPMQPGDVADSVADVTRLESLTGYRPNTSIEIGLRRFVDWYLGFYGHRSPEP